MCNHPHIDLTRPDGTIDRFDADMAPLAQLLFDRGVIERFSCQGDPLLVDQTRYKGRDHRAYIMVELTPESLTFLSEVIALFPALREDRMSWTIEMDVEPLRKWQPPERHNPKPRINMRFPHQDIQKLIEWMLADKARVDLFAHLEEITNSTGEDFNANVEELLRSDIDGKN